MKPLKTFIVEQLEPTKIENVKITYAAVKERLAFTVPETYSENDFMIYLQDRFEDDMPTGEKYRDRFFGKNAANIDDAYFEYESFTKSTEDSYSHDIDVEWDSKYDESKKDTKLAVIEARKLTFNILFNEFELMSNNNGDDADALIENVCKASESSELNKYPFEIKYDSSKTEYEKIDNLEEKKNG